MFPKLQIAQRLVVNFIRRFLSNNFLNWILKNISKLFRYHENGENRLMVSALQKLVISWALFFLNVFYRKNLTMHRYGQIVL